MRSAYVLFTASSLLVLFACTAESTTTSAPAPTEPASEVPDEPATDDDAGKQEPKPVAKDAGVDAAPKKAEWTAGESGKSCADACKAKGKTCAVACTDHRSCGGHDGEPPPYAGYACYYRETKSGGGSFRSNEGRSLKTCDAIATAKWDNWGSEYTLGDYLGGNPVSCCCE
jgi:hypothetical protein